MPEPGKIGFPPDFQYQGLEDFKGLNTKAKRPAIDDEECSWLENLMPIGKSNMRSMYGRGDALYTAPGGLTIVYAAAYNIGNTDYHFVCLSDGTAVQVQDGTGAVITISAVPNRFYDGGDLPHIAQFGASGILIVTTAVSDGYFAWDGTLYSPGDIAPGWLSGLTGGSLVLVGNTNTDTTLTNFASTVGVVVGMVVSAANNDIPADTFVTGGTSTTVTISNAATGSNAGQNITFGWQMPTGIQGTGIDTYQNRVFIANGDQRIMSASGNGAYFAAANGGQIAISTDSNLRKHYTSVISANGFIYYMGDSSLWNIDNVTQTVSNGIATASYQYNNSDPQTGTEWPNSVQIYGRAIIFVNTNGVYDLLGNSATKISDALDGLFENLDTSVIPTCAVGTLFGIRVLAVCFRTTDYLGVTRNILGMFDGKKWWLASQEIAPDFIYTQEISSNLTVFGTDGTIIFPLFQAPSSSLLKTLQSKLYGGKYGYLTEKMSLRYYLELDNLGVDDSTPVVMIDSETSSTPVVGSLAATLTWVNAAGQAINFQNSLNENIIWTLNGLINAVTAQQWGELLGLTLTSTASDFVLLKTGIGYEDETALF